MPVLSEIGVGFLILTGLVVLAVIGLAVLVAADERDHRRRERRTVTQPSRVMPVIDDALPIFFKYSPADIDDAAIEQWLKGDGRNG